MNHLVETFPLFLNIFKASQLGLLLNERVEPGKVLTPYLWTLNECSHKVINNIPQKQSSAIIKKVLRHIVKENIKALGVACQPTGYRRAPSYLGSLPIFCSGFWERSRVS